MERVDDLLKLFPQILQSKLLSYEKEKRVHFSFVN